MSHSGRALSISVQGVDPLDPVAGLPGGAVDRQDPAAEGGGALRHLAPDPAETDYPERLAAYLAMRFAALDPAGMP